MKRSLPLSSPLRRPGGLLRLTIPLGVIAVCAALAAPPPQIVTSTAHTTDAPEVAAAKLHFTPQNISLEWSVTAAGSVAGHDALYMFGTHLRDKNIEDAFPLLAWIDLADGKMREVYPGEKIKQRDQSAALGMDMGAAVPSFGAPAAGASINTPWPWGTPVCATRGGNNSLYLVTAGSVKNVKPTLVRFLPREAVFEDMGNLPTEVIGITIANGTPWLFAGDGRAFTHDDLGGFRAKGRIKLTQPLRALRDGNDGWLYVVTDTHPPCLYAVRHDNLNKCQKLLPGLALEKVDFTDEAPALGCALIVKDGGNFRRDHFLLRDGAAVTTGLAEARAALAKQRGYELVTAFDSLPPQVRVRPHGSDTWSDFPITFKNIGRDKIKSLYATADGKSLYVAGWPVAWIWRYDIATATAQTLGRDYVWYAMVPWRDEIWAVGYWGIKLMRWRPDQPWTFDYNRHYFNKTFPGNTSPWGDKDVSNPRLVCKFRYLKWINVRRPGGVAMGPDGRLYAGGRTPATENFDSRYGGVINWYDPETETIGQIRAPFLHHSVRAVCSAGERYIAAATSRYICMYEPLPENFSPGKFVLYDTKTERVIHESSPIGSPLSYAAEGAPGRIVVAGSGPGDYGGEGVAAAFFIYDTNEMRVTHVVKAAVKARWSEYNVLPFLRGPDNKIYFFGGDDDGTALFRIDSLDGTIEPVLRAKGVTDVALTTNPGSAMAFGTDQVYFGVHDLYALPLSTVIGGNK